MLVLKLSSVLARAYNFYWTQTVRQQEKYIYLIMFFIATACSLSRILFSNEASARVIKLFAINRKQTSYC